MLGMNLLRVHKVFDEFLLILIEYRGTKGLLFDIVRLNRYVSTVMQLRQSK